MEIERKVPHCCSEAMPRKNAVSVMCGLFIYLFLSYIIFQFKEMFNTSVTIWAFML